MLYTLVVVLLVLWLLGLVSSYTLGGFSEQRVDESTERVGRDESQ